MLLNWKCMVSSTLSDIGMILLAVLIDRASPFLSCPELRCPGANCLATRAHPRLQHRFLKVVMPMVSQSAHVYSRLECIVNVDPSTERLNLAFGKFLRVVSFGPVDQSIGIRRVG